MRFDPGTLLHGGPCPRKAPTAELLRIFAGTANSGPTTRSWKCSGTDARDENWAQGATPPSIAYAHYDCLPVNLRSVLRRPIRVDPGTGGTTPMDVLRPVHGWLYQPRSEGAAGAQEIAARHRFSVAGHFGGGISESSPGRHERERISLMSEHPRQRRTAIGSSFFSKWNPTD